MIWINFNQTNKIKYFKNILNKGLTNSLKTERINDYNDLIELIKLHPEYSEKSKNMIDICIKNNKLNPKYYEFNIIKDNGLYEDISYRECIHNNRQKKDSKIKEAMRTAIVPQILDYRYNNIMICNFCNSCQDIHIDHIILFKDLYNEFINNENNIPDTFDTNNYNQYCFTENDKDFKNRWYNFHKNKALLRPLCKICNLKRHKI